MRFTSMRFTPLLVLSAIALGAFSCINQASAGTMAFEANLDPFQEVPPHNTPGYGSANLTLDTTTDLLSIDANTGVYADLLAGATTVRLQDAAPGANGPTITLFTLDTPGNTTGTFSGVSSAALTSAQVTDLIAGNTYLNIADKCLPQRRNPRPGSPRQLGPRAGDCCWDVGGAGRRGIDGMGTITPIGDVSGKLTDYDRHA
jgi:hypothetical protein